MRHTFLPRLIESLALCISATAMVFTLTIAVKMTVILVGESPVFRPLPPQQTEPPLSKARVRPVTTTSRR